MYSYSGGARVVSALTDALPADRLYCVDWATEQIRLRLATNPEGARDLGLDMAQKWFKHAQEQLRRGDAPFLQGATSSYRQTITSVARAM